MQIHSSFKLRVPFEIPFYGDHVSLFTLLMAISTIMYTYLNNQMMGAHKKDYMLMKHSYLYQSALYLQRLRKVLGGFGATLARLHFEIPAHQQERSKQVQGKEVYAYYNP